MDMTVILKLTHAAADLCILKQCRFEQALLKTVHAFENRECAGFCPRFVYHMGQQRNTVQVLADCGPS